ncbi:RE1 [Symbiodinium sp. CCMP2592]|nr:RE1 [Symbiodinium sp. CCMP2592]
MSELLCKAQRGEPRGLIDGGATACLRVALDHEVGLPQVVVKLACGETSLCVNPQGTLLSKVYVSPILSVRALLSLGYRIEWDSAKCRIYHAVKGDLDIDVSSGCPEVTEAKALELISQYEDLVRSRELRSIRVHSIMQDLSSRTDDELASLIIQGDTQADASLQMLLTRLFPETSSDLTAQAAISLQDQEGEPYAWNRRMRRKCDKSDGVLVHLFRGSNKRVFEGLAERSKVTVLSVDKPEDLLSDNTFRYLMQQASKGRVKGIVASPPYRTFALCRYLSGTGDDGLRPLRVRGESIGETRSIELGCKEQAQRRTDDLVLMRTMVLMIVAAASNRALRIHHPLCAVVHPEDPTEDPVECWDNRELEDPGTGYATLWETPEWKSVERFLGLQGISFRQGVKGQGMVRPTRMCTNMAPDPLLINGREGLQYFNGLESSMRPECGSEVSGYDCWGEWSCALQSAICSMLWRELREQGLWGEGRLRALDPGFIEHVRQGHMPFRRDCKQCLQGSARHRQHRKVLAPQAWTLSLDTAGPFPAGVDESECQAKYLIVAVLSVPILSTEGHVVTEPADRDPAITVEAFAESLDDKEWFLGKGMELEDPPDEFTAAELKEAKEAWNSWQKIVAMSRKEWMEEAKVHYLPKVEMVDMVYTEPDLNEWPLAAKLAAYQMRGQARKRLKMSTEPCMGDQNHCCAHEVPVYGQLKGCDTKDHLYLTKYLTGSVPNIVLPIVASGGGLWIQDRPDAGLQGVSPSAEEVRVWLHKELRLEVEVQRHKVAVCEEFPARCPKKDDPLPYEVPKVLQRLSLCPSSGSAEGVSYSLDRVSWQMGEELEEVVDAMTNAHYVRSKMLEVSYEDVEGWLKGCDEAIFNEVQELERELQILQGGEQEALRRLVQVEGGRARQPRVCSATVSDEGDDGPASQGADDSPPLQTKIVSQQQVRQELGKWQSSMSEEVESLVQKTEAVEDLTEAQYNELVSDGSVHVELIPGKMVYVWKPSGRRRARMVGCGNFCEHDSSAPKADLFASGAGAESIRMMIRKCAMESSWSLVSVDVKTAFLQAPLMEMQKGGREKVTVVKVPSILREAGVTTTKYWKVKKALYGLNSAPRSWSTYRDRVMTDLCIEHGDSFLRLQKLPEDANLWHILKYPREGIDPKTSAGAPGSQRGQHIGIIALYVDDILIASEKDVSQAIVQGLESHWELSTPDWLSVEGDCLKFAGFELEKTSLGIRLHQESYTKDLLDQCRDTVQGVERVPAVKMSECEDPADRDEQLKLTKRAQSLVGQLLWLSGRTRPDISYAVSVAAQKIVPSPREAVERAEHVIKYLRYAPGIGLHYKMPTGRCGKWEQLKFRELGESLDAFSDASFAADERSRSYGCIQLFWGGALAWQSYETYRCSVDDLEEGRWQLTHLDGVYMPAAVAPPVSETEQQMLWDMYERLYAEQVLFPVHDPQIARAPTVPMPPENRYPIVLLQPDPEPQLPPRVNRIAYVDDEVELDSSADEAESTQTLRDSELSGVSEDGLEAAEDRRDADGVIERPVDDDEVPKTSLRLVKLKAVLWVLEIRESIGKGIWKRPYRWS